jgi:hypothetical protein
MAADVGVGVQDPLASRATIALSPGDVHDAPVPGRQRIGVAGIEPPAVEEAVAFGGEHGRRAVVVTTERRRVLAVHVHLPAPLPVLTDESVSVHYVSLGVQVTSADATMNRTRGI